MGPERQYVLGPRERKGSVAGWRVGQVVTTGVGCAAAMLSVVTLPSATGFVVAVACVVTALSAATIPWRGRTIEEWIPVIVFFCLHRGVGEIASFSIRAGDKLGIQEAVGVIVEKPGALSVVLIIESTGIALLSPDEKDYRIDGFIDALSAMAREGSAVDRASWTMWTQSNDAQELFRDFRIRGDHGSGVAQVAYRSLLEELTERGVTRRVALTLRLSAPRKRGSMTIQKLVDEAMATVQSLEESGHQSVRCATASELRSMFASFGELDITDLEDSVDVAVSGNRCFGYLDREGALIASWWITEWPRHGVNAEVLAPLMLGDPRRLVSVVAQPVAPSTALRKAQSAKTTSAADDELRRRGGFLSDRRREREADHLVAREAELVDGHGSLRISGFVTVIAENEASLAALVIETQLVASQAHLVLQRLQGDHGRGFMATLPLGVGLP